MSEVGVNNNYYREYARLIQAYSLMRPIGFILGNTGSSLLRNPRIRLQVPKAGGVQLRTESRMPDKPKYNWLATLPSTSTPVTPVLDDAIEIATRGDSYEVIIELEDVQPKDRAVSEEFYIGAEHETRIECEAVVFADNLPEPVRIPIIIDIATEEQLMPVDELMQQIKRIEESNKKGMERWLEEHGMLDD